jgi:tRNA pseudouridine synthase 10
MYTALDDVYEFDSFLIGTSLATQFLEREDEVRAKFKIRGTMSIKNHITNAVRNKFRTLTSAREKFEKPDLVIILNIFSDKTYSFTAKSKSIVAAGRVLKGSSLIK